MISSILIAALAATAHAIPLAARQYGPGGPYGPGNTTQPSGSPSLGPSGPPPTGTGAPYTTMASMNTATLTASLLGVATATPVAGQVPGSNTALVAKLITDDTTVDRFKDIAASNTSLKFDFNPAANPGVKSGLGGEVVLANRGTFPVLTDLGLTAAGLFFEPCGLNTPHIHPRASEFFTLATNNNVLTGFVLENGLTTEFNTTLTQFQGTVFPQGSIHFQQNLDCTPAVGISALNSEDPGASSILQNFFSLDSGVVEASLGFPSQISAANLAQFEKSIPAPFVLGIQECLQKCGIPY